jgi:hypothetical protein
MPYQKPVETDQLFMPSSPEFWVRMKKRASHGDRAAAQDAMLSVARDDELEHDGTMTGKGVVIATGQGYVSKAELSTYTAALICRLVLEWNFTDDKDEILPITIETILAPWFDPDDGDLLAEEATRRAKLKKSTGSPEGEPDPFSLPASATSTLDPATK